ncbi:hypothetical protein IC229_32190 [Spirosoma sp. BT702]|uniref:Uncharacterized protein n=1 Tax=Spirosoma profusum TaxID=2771354 RepID=A0A927GAC2_9BACT|nr:hypothetical protein [Spirosoma profusum]
MTIFVIGQTTLPGGGGWAGLSLSRINSDPLFKWIDQVVIMPASNGLQNW